MYLVYLECYQNARCLLEPEFHCESQSATPIVFLSALCCETAGKTEWGYSGAIMVITTQNGSSHAKLNNCNFIYIINGSNVCSVRI